MSKQANTKLIGGFVVGAIALVLLGILLFGSGKLFSEQRKFVLFFSDSVSGLSIGAPVDFRGVKIGRVTQIKVVLEKEDMSLRIPVYIELEPGRFRLDTKLHTSSEGDLTKTVEAPGTNAFLDLLISRGLRAQLAIQSLVTGQLGIHLDFFPEKPANLVGAEPDYQEIPTVGSSLSELTKTLQNIPVADIADSLLKALDGAQKVINSPEMKDTIVALHQAMEATRDLLVNFNARFNPLATSAELTLGESREMLANASKLARNLDEHFTRIAAGLDDTLKTAGTTMKGASRAIDAIAGDNSPVRLELIKTLNEFASAARSFRILADYIENHPEALVRGKGNQR